MTTQTLPTLIAEEQNQATLVMKEYLDEGKRGGDKTKEGMITSTDMEKR